jgi:hypothetical protein
MAGKWQSTEFVMNHWHHRHAAIRRLPLRGLGVDYAQDYGVSQPQKVQRAAIA